MLLNRLDDAEKYFSSALRLSSGEDDAEMEAVALLGLLAVSRERGDFEAARAARDRADQFIQAHFPPEHAARMNFVFESGLLDLADDSLADAKARLQQVLSQYQRTNRRVPDQIVALAGLARCELQSGELGPAAGLAAEASALARKSARSRAAVVLAGPLRCSRRSTWNRRSDTRRTRTSCLPKRSRNSRQPWEPITR